ncbi:MAG: type III secretion system chaperone [Pseudomonadota bacterium]
MSREHYVAEIIAELGAGLGLSGFALDGSQRASLIIDGLPVTFTYVAAPVELVWIYVDLGEVPENDPRALDALLQLGFLTWASNRMTLGVDDRGERVIGQAAIPAINLDLPALRGQLGQITESAFLIRDRLTRGDFNLETQAA